MKHSSKPASIELPKWWLLVNTGINAAIRAGRKSYLEPGAVLDEILDDNGKVIFYVIRDRSSAAKLMSAEEIRLTVGSKIKGNLTLLDLRNESEEPELNSYIYNIIIRQVYMIPKIWLYKTIKNRLDGAPMTERDYKSLQKFDASNMSSNEIDFKIFQKWIYVPNVKRGDKPFIEMLRKILDVGGLKSLSKFNFIFDEIKVN